MTEKSEVRFEEAEKYKNLILTSIALICVSLSWLVRQYPLLLGVVTILSVYLLTGDRYQWVYIWKKTFYRDMIGVRVLLITMFKLWFWERTGTTVVSRWSKIVKKTPDKKAFIMGDRSLTFRQGDEFSNRIAWYFKRQGFKTGEVIALFMETQPEYVFLWLGLAKLRVTTALVNINLRGAQLIHCLRIAGCKAVVFGDEMTDAIKAIQSEIPDIPLFQFNSPERETAPVLQDTIPLAAELNEMTNEPFSDVEPAKPRDTLLYIYTSGTTGFPKAAIITNIRYLLIPLGVHTSAQLNSSDVVYDPLPLHHSAGGVLGAGQCLVLGCTVVLRKKFSASNYWTDVAKHKCTAAQYIGEICRYLLTVPPSDNDRAHNVRIMIGNGLRPQIWQEFVDRFSVKRVLEFYGATEGNSNLVNLDSKVGAIGFLSRLVSSIYPLTLVKCDELTGEILRNENGRCINCGPYEPGLLLGKIDPKKAILTFAGYADKTASEKKMVRNVRVKGDCYFNTGDILEMDYYGYFYFKDRTGDTFRWRGENVSTAEVEGVISNLVGLKDAVVYGVPIPYVEGKAGMAAIADPEKKVDLKNLAEGLKSSLPAYARPLFVRILPEPPLTATFKLKKKVLMEQGFNINIHDDPIYFLDQKSGTFVPLTQKLYDDLNEGVIRL
ncbi:long-chain fatty acid transport protein 1 [Nymphalis io]|uniref:long-chain fatty acid transport protein 1 n=1 Tax=Inachis io TaxID=171585 RepID=UPI002167D228|nr:long-chain fatty acid transport protein 1 [Nymphalis io]XP_050356092.1 long-chain fatty acid transport protein 1 [Nymphalis io]XP_050356093.1 long-chain fatty acid transport protein 1 [Nymphalis io]XP_050356094.1 long-chain fatty acid transport protein 1 [Nymphalis io]